MKSRSTDPRARRTRDMLREALMASVVDKPFRDLTIRDITDHAGVNRATFYLHYEDKYDLLEDCATVLFGELRDAVESNVAFDPATIVDRTEEKYGQRMNYLLHHLEAHFDFYHAMFCQDGDAIFYGLFLDNATVWIKSQVTQVLEYLGKDVDDEWIDMMVRFQSAGNFDVLRWWLENQMRIPIDVMAKRLEIITLPPIIQMLTDETLKL
jgi:AcrR family transcriptional regulator